MLPTNYIGIAYLVDQGVVSEYFGTTKYVSIQDRIMIREVFIADSLLRLQGKDKVKVYENIFNKEITMNNHLDFPYLLVDRNYLYEKFEDAIVVIKDMISLKINNLTDRIIDSYQFISAVTKNKSNKTKDEFMEDCFSVSDKAINKLNNLLQEGKEC